MRQEDALFSTIICDRHTKFTLFEDLHDLAFAVPAPFHIRIFYFPV